LNTQLITAAKEGDASRIQALLAGGANIDARDGERGATALLWASSRGHIDAVTALLRKGANVNATTKDGATALMLAAEAGHQEVIKALLAARSDVNAKNVTGQTALIAASDMGRVEIAEYLLSNKADANVKDTNGQTALFYASAAGHTRVVQGLLAKGAEVNTKSIMGTTALMAASLNGHREIVQSLLAAGADVNARNNNGWTAIMGAEQRGHAEIVQILVSAGAKAGAPPAPPKGEAMLEAAKTGDLDKIKSLIQAGESPHLRGNVKGVNFGGELMPLKDTTALHVAAVSAQLEAVKLLLAAGADINLKDGSGLSPLHYACASAPESFIQGAAGRLYGTETVAAVQVVKFLLANGANPNLLSSPLNQTPLHLAAYFGYKTIVAALLEKGANADLRDSNGKTPLDLAAPTVKEILRKPTAIKK
jgi:ankyrin repeat protein